MRKKRRVNRNGGLILADDVNQEITWHPGVGQLAVRHFQPNRDLILEANATMRREEVVRDLSWCRWALRIPSLDLMQLKKINPELNSMDGAIKTAAWKKFCRSPESLPYRVRDKI